LYFSEGYYIPYFQFKLQKIIPILDTSSNVTESGQNRFGEHGPLGVKNYSKFSDGLESILCKLYFVS
jgi:hypothetical protein